MSDYHFLLKNIVIGDTCVGKSCLMLQLIEKTFKNLSDPTVGVEFGAKHFTLDGLNVKMQIWDTAGQESFKSITRSYYRGAIGAVLVFDVTNRESFVNVAKWLEDLSSGASKNIQIILVGNKSDLADSRAISPEEANELASAHNLPYFETSAKTGENVELVFETLARKVVEKIKRKEIDVASEFGVILGENQSSNSAFKRTLQQRRGRNCCRS